MTPTQNEAGITDEQLRALIAEIQNGQSKQEATPPVQTPPAPVKNEIKLGDKTFSGTNEEIARDIAAYQEQLTRDAQARAIQEQAQQQEAQRQAEAKGYDKAAIKKMLAEKIEDDPVEAWKAMNQHVFGVPDVAGLLKQMALTIAQNNVELTAMKFAQETDWPGGEDNYNALNKVMVENGIPPTLQGMKVAYQVGKAQGRFKLEETEEAAPPAPAPAAKTPRAPIVRRDGVSEEAAAPADDSMFDNMSLEQMEALISKLPAKARR